MPRLTPSPARETTRKPPRRPAPARPASARRWWPACAAALAAAFAGGCATPGPLHVYSVAAPTGEPPVLDHGTAAAARTEVPSFLGPDDLLLGFAYDPFTDHFFLRLAPGNVVRVVDRPARAIKREFTIEGLPADGGGDLAARPRDGHLFFLTGRGAEVVVANRYGKRLRAFTLAGVTAPRALAVDAIADQLWVFDAAGRRFTRHAPDGPLLSSHPVAADLAPSLAVDGGKRELYAPLAADGTIAVFDFSGRLLRRLDLPPAPFVDVGPRSLIRVF